MTRVLFASLLLGAIAAFAVGQAPPPTELPPRPFDPLLDATPVLVELPKAPAEESVRVSFDVGFPTGVRIQARLFESRFWAEAGVGLWWIFPYASAALRYDCHMYEGRWNLAAVRPSVSATFIPIGRVPVGFGADVEFIWQHRFTDRIATDLGFRLGASAFQGDYGGWGVIPVATLVFALQF